MGIRNVHFCKTFISLFKKTASLSPQKKISIKWILYLADGKLCYSLILIRIRILVDIYLKYGDLFIDDVDSNEWKKELMIHKDHSLLLGSRDFTSLYPGILIR